MSKRGNYGQWSQANLEEALNAYRNNGVGLNECQRRYHVPKATLKRHLENKNKIANDKTKALGRPTDFSQEIENLLVKHIVKFEERMFGLTITDIRRLAYDLAEDNHISHRFNTEKRMAGKKWFYGFMRRHPQLSVRQPESTSIARAKGFNRERVQHFFDIFEQLVDKYKITANTIFNVDESGISTVQKRMPKVVSLKGKRQVGGITSGERGVNTTAVCCLSAAGLYIPPMLIFKRKRYAPELEIGAPLGGSVEISDTGYINSDLFLKWLKHFKNVVQPGPEKAVILLLDGHSTHSKNLDALNYAREHNIHLLQLPGHTTHRLQPLDVAFFKPLQSYYVQAQEKWLRANVGKTISQYHVAALFSEAYGRAATVEIAASAFRGSGIWPVDRNHFKDHDFAISEVLCLNEGQIHESTIMATDNSETEITVISTHSDEKQSDPIEIDISENIVTVKPMPTTPSCSKTNSAFEDSLNKISPLPTTHLDKIGKRKERAGQVAVELTSSPYKTELEEKKMTGKKRGRTTKTTVKSITHKTSCKKKTREEKGVKNLFRDTKMPKLDSESSETEDDDDAECLHCGGTYLCSKKGEGWVRCDRCLHWAHEECAAVEDNDDFICDMCVQNGP